MEKGLKMDWERLVCHFKQAINNKNYDVANAPSVYSDSCQVTLCSNPVHEPALSLAFELHTLPPGNLHPTLVKTRVASPGGPQQSFPNKE